MTKIVFMVCGVPGSGKSWVCEQLKDLFTYVSHDECQKYLPEVIAKLAQVSEKPMLTDCPFGERPLRVFLMERGLHVVPIFIVERPEVIALRYQLRENRPFPKAHSTRALTIRDRALEWHAPFGTSEEVLQMLKNPVDLLTELHAPVEPRSDLVEGGQ